MHVTWPKVFESMVMDNENHSDFDPLCAPNWALQISEKECHHLLSQHIVQFLQACQSTTPVNELIGDLLKRKHFSRSYLYVYFIVLTGLITSVIFKKFSDLQLET